MSDTTLRVVEVVYGPDDLPVVHADAWQALEAPLMQFEDANGLAVYFATGGVAYGLAESVREDIRARIDAGSSSPVLKSHLDDLGITAAVTAWAAD